VRRGERKNALVVGNYFTDASGLTFLSRNGL
jgi:hypothetical protein